MIKLGVTVLAGALFLTGCSDEAAIDNGTNGQQEEQVSPSPDEQSEAWDYKQGRVVAIDTPKLLVVQSSDVKDLELAPTKEAIEELLDVVRPEAVWVSVMDEKLLDGIEVGDEVSVEIQGELSDTYPAEGEASDVREVMEMS
ncbi:DUF3221 domain-containing protein [Paenibacillus sp. strain BS8-2]